MSTKFYVIAVWTLLSFVVKVNAQEKVECWDRFELSFKQVTKGNPFDTRLSACLLYTSWDSSVGYGLWIYFLFHVPYFLILPQMYKSKVNNPLFFFHNIIF